MSTETTNYIAKMTQWRAAQEERLRADDGWLAVAGLFWLHEGRNRLGTDPTAEVVLPPGSAPDEVGVIVLEDGQPRLQITGPAQVTVNGVPATACALRSDAAGTPDVIAIGDISLLVIQRGARTGIRMRDRNAPARQSFTGRRWFPVDESYRVQATFTPYDPPITIPITNILGDTTATLSPGAVHFALNGNAYQLDATAGGNGGLFLIFRDLTSSHETYPAARFLSTLAPVDGRVLLDFNQAVNPPCAFTAYATCPLPPRQNYLSTRIEAGEQYTGIDHEVEAIQ